MLETAVVRANRLIAAGATAAGVDVVQKAAAAGDVDALMQLAVWRLVGSPVSRDLVQARALLRRAVTIGHVDAALMEIALTANGSGGAADWRAAHLMLAEASTGDPLAAEQLALLGAMAIDPDGLPTTMPQPEILSTSPHVVRFRSLFTARECAHVAGIAGAMLGPARVIDPRSGQWIAHPIRTSDDAAIGPAREDLVIRALNQRIAMASGTKVDQGEPLTVLRYRPGQEYRLHLDAIQDVANQRVMTMLVYLNEGYFGGETWFPHGNLTVKPRGGDVILFMNCLADGRVDPASRHAGLPVTSGVKWLATRWIRSSSIDPWTMS